MADFETASGLPSIDALGGALARKWWVFAVRGLCGVLFGVVSLWMPLATMATLMLFLGAYLLVDGALAVVAGVRAATHHERWGLLALEGVVNLLAGAAIFLWPGLSMVYLVVLLGVWSAISGIMLIGAAFRLPNSHGRWWVVLAGVASLVWGVLLWQGPVTGAIVLAWWLGSYAFIFGLLLLVIAFRLRQRAHGTGSVAPL